ncbi:MAG: serine/threonine protein kinase [Deltaproteobacteria bacterium]|nr:serine/threonine protein kinase [Deltaproteobacteria bacterium]
MVSVENRPILHKAQLIDSLSEGIGMAATVVGLAGHFTSLTAFYPLRFIFKLGTAAATATLLWNGFRSGDRFFTQKIEQSRDRVTDGLFFGGAITGLGGLLCASFRSKKAFYFNVIGSMIDLINWDQLRKKHEENPEQVTTGQVSIQLGLTFLFSIPIGQRPPPGVREVRVPYQRTPPLDTEKPLGSGCFSDVYSIKNDGGTSQGAVKVACPRVRNPLTNLAIRQTIEHEIEIIAPRIMPLNSPYLVRIEGCVQYSFGRRGMIMERLQGNTLQVHLGERGRLPVHASVDLFLDYARGVRDLHRVGVIHRDLKPSSLWAPETGPGKILDFGLSAIVNPRTARIAPRADDGTIRYMPPEAFPVLRREDAQLQHYSYPSDIFSLGASFYESLTGTMLYPNGVFDPRHAVLVHLAKTTPPPPLSCRFGIRIENEMQRVAFSELNQIIRKSVAYYPRDRYQTANEFIEALLGWKSRHGTVEFVP